MIIAHYAQDLYNATHRTCNYLKWIT